MSFKKNCTYLSLSLTFHSSSNIIYLIKCAFATDKNNWTKETWTLYEWVMYYKVTVWCLCDRASQIQQYKQPTRCNNINFIDNYNQPYVKQKYWSPVQQSHNYRIRRNKSVNVSWDGKEPALLRYQSCIFRHPCNVSSRCSRSCVLINKYRGWFSCSAGAFWNANTTSAHTL